MLPSPIGKLGLNLSARGVEKIAYLTDNTPLKMPRSGLGLEVLQQMTDYFELRRKEFNLPLDIKGTPYQQKVWKVVSSIPYGKSKAYSEIARKINSGPRAVGNACRHNPVPIIIPCHRVTKKNAVGGYCGSIKSAAVQQKDWLLQHEQVHQGVLTNGS